jgi:membrane-bound metal-dependent hydrolase YbcI (DUF457 family)
MMGRGHAVSGLALWLAGWAWTAEAGLGHPHLDVLTVGTLVCAGGALFPDLDHPNSRLAHSGGPLTRLIAKGVGRAGAGIHAATKLDADRPDSDGHRTVTHTIVFAALMGTLVTGLCSLDGITGKILAALLVYVFVRLGAVAVRDAFPGRKRRVRLLGRRRRFHKPTVVALLCAAGSFALVPADVWWLGLAVGVGCFTHLLGDLITASGCPILWPVPIPSRVQRYDARARQRVPQRVWRTWYLVGTPQWMRFRVGSPAEDVVTWCLVVAGVAAVAGLVYAGGWGPAAHG